MDPPVLPACATIIPRCIACALADAGECCGCACADANARLKNNIVKTSQVIARLISKNLSFALHMNPAIPAKNSSSIVR